MSANHEHYNYFMNITGDADLQKYTCAGLIASLILLVSLVLTKRIRTKDGIAHAVIPSARFSAFSFMDFCVESFIAFQDSILGKANRGHASFTFTIFAFLLISNLIGLIPGMPSITTTVWINVGMGIVVFLYFNIMGIKSQGLVGYLKHFAGPMLLLAPLVFPLEILSIFLRILTLNLRLYWNITADHLVLSILTDLADVAATPIYLLGTFVSFMQAFVFTTLTMIYILLATQHGDDHHEEGGHH